MLVWLCRHCQPAGHSLRKPRARVRGGKTRGAVSVPLYQAEAKFVPHELRDAEVAAS